MMTECARPYGDAVNAILLTTWVIIVDSGLCSASVPRDLCSKTQ